MADDSVRIDLAFEGGQVLSVTVAADAADALERALAASAQGPHPIDTEDGRVTVVLSRVAYLRRYARQSTPGFGIS